MLRILSRLLDTLPRLATLDRRLDEVKINQGLILCEMHRHKLSDRLTDYEFKVFSQWGEDGILQHLIAHLPMANRTFIEFGVEDFFESNCRFLLMKDLWRGYVIDGSRSHIERLRSSYFYWKFPLTAKASFITRENVAALLDESGFDRELGILSIDVDGVDYHLLEALGDWRATIIVIEYNGLFGHRRSVTVPYDAAFTRTQAHWSNLYWGASLPAFDRLLRARGYALVGVNSMGSNAFFVRRDLLNERVRECSIEACAAGPVFREGRDAEGRLTLQSAQVSRDLIASMPLLDLESGRHIVAGDLFRSAQC
jgi:hypothetical protein